MNLFQKKITLMLVLTFIFSFSFGVATMPMDENGNMSACPFMNSDTICSMSFSEHIATFKSIFRAVPSKIISLAFLFLTAFLFASRRNPSHLLNNSEVLSKHWTDLYSSILPLTPLRRAFATGILNPKIY